MVNESFFAMEMAELQYYVLLITLTTALLICPIHTVSVSITYICWINTAVIRTLKLTWVARAYGIYSIRKQHDHGRMITYSRSNMNQTNLKHSEVFLTAVGFIRAITTVIICVTEPSVWDAPVVGTAELVSLACAWDLCRTVAFITAIKTIIVPIAAPIPGHTVLVGTGEG